MTSFTPTSFVANDVSVKYEIYNIDDSTPNIIVTENYEYIYSKN